MERDMTGRLQLRSITCIKQQETGDDELYLTFTGRKISLPNMTRGQTKVLSGDYEFSGSQPLNLFENDGDHWYDRDDHIGTHTITESDSPGDFPLEFDGAGAHYTLVLRVFE
jgi:hypothetical protein